MEHIVEVVHITGVFFCYSLTY